MRGWLILCGGDEFRPACEQGDRAILEALQPNLVAVVPTAQASRRRSDAVKAGKDGVRYFRGLGAEAESVLITDRESASEASLVSRLEAADLVYMTGGNPGYLLRTLHDTPALDAITNSWRAGRALVGSSAGAMVLCEIMLDRPPEFDHWIEALGLVPKTLAVVHHERDTSARGLELLSALPSGFRVIGIDACNNAVSLPDDSWQMLGGGTVRVYESGKNEPRGFSHGDTWHMQDSLDDA